MGTPTQCLQVKKKKVIKSPTSFYEYPFNNTAQYHVLKRYNFSCSHYNISLLGMKIMVVKLIYLIVPYRNACYL